MANLNLCPHCKEYTKDGHLGEEGPECDNYNFIEQREGIEKRKKYEDPNPKPPAESSEKVAEDDEGPLQLTMHYDKPHNIMVINFGKPVRWIGFSKQDAIRLAMQIMTLAKTMP